MAEGDFSRKFLLQNTFYLELEKQGGLIESVLSDDEIAIWQQFPVLHQQLFLHQYDGEWLLKCSLQAFTASAFKREHAFGAWQFYLTNRQRCPLIMTVDDFIRFLFPLVDLRTNYLQQSLAQAIQEQEENPTKLLELMTPEWEDYTVLTYPINLRWLEKQSDDYLVTCAQIWRDYHTQSSQLATHNITLNRTPEPMRKRDILGNPDRQRQEILKVLQELNLQPLALIRGDKLKVWNEFSKQYQSISRYVFDDRWKELTKRKVISLK